VREQEPGAIKRAAHESPVGSLPAADMLEAGEDSADERHQADRPVGRRGDAEQDSRESSEGGGDYEARDHLDRARPLAEQRGTSEQPVHLGLLSLRYRQVGRRGDRIRGRVRWITYGHASGALRGSPELTGWFDDFGQSGKSDAFGGIGRIAVGANMFSAGPPGIPCPSQLDVIGGICSVLDPAQLLSSLGIKNLQRCPGSNERGLTEDQLTQAGALDCDPGQVPLGP
jgi:hypothetical protein